MYKIGDVLKMIEEQYQMYYYIVLDVDQSQENYTLYKLYSFKLSSVMLTYWTVFPVSSKVIKRINKKTIAKVLPMLKSKDISINNFAVDILFNKCKYLTELKKNLEKISK
jgi:hypothetical protein